ncbi:MAG: tRNA 2-thiouridine(34) synthase MnmA, partial [Alistipes sp.]|nr:tRNA 2-thiouridine(34) synthase MnmA [Alistipes sp.]
GHYRLLAGVDGNKDQSYFLCQLSQQQLSRAMFPIGGLLKPEVRRIAEEQKLATAKRKDSQGICFVGKVDLPTFLQQKLAAKRGDIIELPADGGPGRKVGEHDGAHFYTIGQRKGLGVGGRQEPLFVVATDVEKNIVYVGEGDSHPGLWRGELTIAPGEVHWVRPDRALAPGGSERFSFRIRYRQPLQGGVLKILEDGGAHVVFDSPQRGVTPGQFAAWYDDNELIGSGVILR